MTERPMQPTPELIERLLSRPGPIDDDIRDAYIAGADAELDACVEWVQGYAECGDSLRAARRPKPPSLKQQALEALMRFGSDNNGIVDDMKDGSIIRRALEQLPDD